LLGVLLGGRHPFRLASYCRSIVSRGGAQNWHTPANSLPDGVSIRSYRSISFLLHTGQIEMTMLIS
jgi:hypothetical protein